MDINLYHFLEIQWAAISKNTEKNIQKGYVNKTNVLTVLDWSADHHKTFKKANRLIKRDISFKIELIDI